jgi:ESCRT-II complex subunit VPS36
MGLGNGTGTGATTTSGVEASTAPAYTAARASHAGVGGILLRQRQEAAARQNALGEAFTDMEALMDKAKDMVLLAEHFTRALQKQRQATQGDLGGHAGTGTGGGGGGGESASSAAEASEMEVMMLSLGITSPVTRDSAGALYHQELARQLADWLPPVLHKAGGILPLPDVFCIFNRARGSELISPDDLLKACQLWAKLRIPLQCRVFSSGVTVVQSLDRSDDEVCAVLLRAVATSDDDVGTDEGAVEAGAGTRNGGAAGVEGVTRNHKLRRLDTYGASVALGIPPAIAREYLLMAEGHGILCRDEGPDATYYYPNFFASCC